MEGRVIDGDACRISSSSVWGALSAVEKNFFINSAFIAGDAPLRSVPLMMVTFSVLNPRPAASVTADPCSPETEGMLTAVNPPLRVVSNFRELTDKEWSAFSPFAPSALADDDGLGMRAKALLIAASFSRLLIIADLRFLRRWLSWRARAETAEGISSALDWVRKLTLVC